MRSILLALVCAGCAGAAVAAGTVSLNGAWKLECFPQPDDGAVRMVPLPARLAVSQKFTMKGGKSPFKWSDYRAWTR